MKDEIPAKQEMMNLRVQESLSILEKQMTTRYKEQERL